ncbi:hypothetical protein T261_5616 [Streptomyces lydicus]|nr:hypothetical protein T261_5616 [Streptomyces lydicus]
MCSRHGVRRLPALRAWAEEIDPVTEDGDHWEHIFDGSLDDPDSY